MGSSGRPLRPVLLRAAGLAVLSPGPKADAPYKQLLVAGLGALWMIQTFIIVGGNVGLLPLTGITLPFISFGGSSLVINFVALGIVLRFSSETAARMERN